MCHIIDMTLDRLELRPGQSIFDQVVHAAIRAFVSGAFRPGQAFPSVRGLAADLKIHPNTAHKVIQHLIAEGWLEVRPGIGTIVASPPEARETEKTRLLTDAAEQLVVAAKSLGVTREEVVAAIERHWSRLNEQQGTDEPNDPTR
jgi:GntR family transcriptional regulator